MKKLLFAPILLALLLPPATPALASDTRAELPAEDPTPAEAPRPQWQQLFPPTSPPARTDHAMAYDTARGVAVLFGGYINGIAQEDTWEWDSATLTWTERFPAHRPPPRFGAALAYDEARGVYVLFGGVNSLAQEYNDSWEWDGNDWTQMLPGTSPSERWASSVVYDSQRQVVVLFGGLKDGIYYGDTWEWDGINWTGQVISGPSPRCCAGLAYDRRRNVAVLFGGDDSAPGAFNDTWERAGAGPWQQVFPPLSPSGRERPGAAYFPRLKRTVLYGGEDLTFYDDTFVWDGQNWRRPQFDPRPAGRCCMGMVYDSVLRGVLLFGGSVSFIYSNDTWIFR